MKKLLLFLCCVMLVAGCVSGLFGDEEEKLPPFSVEVAHEYFDKKAEVLALPEMLYGKDVGSKDSMQIGINADGTPATRIPLTPNWDAASF